MEYKQTPMERWSGKLLRWLLAYLFFIGVVMAAMGVYHLELNGVTWGIIITVPYLVMRYRDPESTTIPFAERVRAYTE